MYNKIKELLGDSFIYGFANIITRFIGFFLIPFYTKVFTPSDYGNVAIFTNGYTLVTIILVFALDSAASRWYYDTEDIIERKKTINSWLWFYLTVSFIAMIFIYALSGFLQLSFFPNLGNAEKIIKILAINLVTVVFNAVTVNVLRFERRPIATLLLSTTITLCTVFLSMYMVLILKVGIIGIFLSQLIASIIGAFYSLILIRKWLDLPLSYDFNRLKEMLLYSWPFIPATLAYWVVNLSGVFFIKYYWSESEVGLFQIGISIASSIGLLINSFQQAWSPFAFSIMNQENAKQTFRLVLDLYVVGILAACVTISLFSKDLLVLLTNSKYYYASQVSSILVYSYFFIGLISIADLGLSIMKKTKPLGFIMFLSALLTITLNIFLIPRYGIIGSAIAICLSQMINPVYMFLKSQRVYPIPYDFSRAIILFSISILITTISILFLNEVSYKYFILKISVFVIYVILGISIYKNIFLRMLSKVKTLFC